MTVLHPKEIGVMVVAAFGGILLGVLIDSEAGIWIGMAAIYGPWLLFSSGDDADGEEGGRPDVEDRGRCSGCGRLVADGKARCDDCSLVGRWRK